MHNNKKEYFSANQLKQDLCCGGILYLKNLCKSVLNILVRFLSEQTNNIVKNDVKNDVGAMYSFFFFFFFRPGHFVSRKFS